MDVVKFILGLDGILYGVDAKGEKHTDDAFDAKKINKTKSGNMSFMYKENLYDVEKEVLPDINIKDADSVKNGLNQIRDMVVSNNRTFAEIKSLGESIQKLVERDRYEGQRSQMADRRRWETDTDLLADNLKADNIVKSIIPGVKIYRDATGREIEEGPKGDEFAAKMHEFQRRSDEIYTIASLMSKNVSQSGKPQREVVQNLKAYQDLVNWAQASGLGKALSMDGTGTGAEWMPVEYSPRLYEKVRLALRVAALHDQIPVNLGSTLKPPVQLTDATGYLIAENDTDEGTKTRASTPTTSNFTLDLVKIASRIVVSSEASEDSIVAMMPFVERNVVQAIANAIENATINGDTTAPHQDSNVTDAQDARKAWKGYRKYASDKSATIDFSNADPTATLLRTVMATMGSPYAIKWTDLAWVLSATSYLLLLNELNNKANANLVTLVSGNPNAAALLPGQLLSVYGIPAIVSEYQQSDLNASGVYDGSTTDRSICNLVYRPGFVYGVKTNGIQISRVLDPETDQIKAIAKQRIDFKDIFGSTKKTVASGYNVDES